MTPPGRGDPPQGDEPPLQLELADVPRRLPRGPGSYADPLTTGPEAASPAAAQTGAQARRSAAADSVRGTMAPAGMAPAGHAVSGEPSRWPRRVVTVLLAALLAWGAYGGYKRLTRKDVVAISSPYKSSTGLTIDLPGRTGWKSDRRMRLKQSFANGWMRGDVMFQGPNVDEADQFALVLRVHAPGAFARSVDTEQMRASLERALQQGAVSAGANARSLKCLSETTWRTDTAVVCYGRVVLPLREMPAAAYLWVAGDDDLVGIAYATGVGSLDAFEAMARSAR